MMSRAPDGLRVASYNIRKAVGTDRRRNPHRILQVISELDADIVVLQEADRRMGARPSVLSTDEIRTQTGLVALPVSVAGPSLGWHGNALLARPEIRVSDLRRVNLPGLEPRGAVVADLHTSDARLRVVGAHLGLLRASRRRQVSALIETLGTMEPLPTLVAGDLNEWSLKVGLGRMSRHFTLHAPGKSFHANLPLGALDRIALDRHMIRKAAGVLDTPITRRASDHLPIWIDIHVGPGPDGRRDTGQG